MNTEKVIKDSLVNFNGKVAVYYDDLKGNVIKINEKEQYNAASCIKVFILIELFNQINNGTINRNIELTYLDKHYVIGSGLMQYLSKGIKLPILDVATLMMIISDNVATNMLIEFLGIDNINNTIDRIGCKDTKLYSEFKSVENEVFSVTTAYDYYLVWKKLNNLEIFDKQLTGEIINIIKNGKYHEMVGDGIDKIYRKVENPMVNYIATKSGKYQSIRNDGGIVSTIYGNYILTILIKDFKDQNYMNDEYPYSQGRKISGIIFNEFIRKCRGKIMNRIVIAGFGCIGKTELAKKDNRFVDLESSKYKYIQSDELLSIPEEKRKGRKDRILNKEFPQNYLNAIIESLRNKNVLISMHYEIIELLKKNNIEYVIVYPEEEMLDEIIERCEKRGNIKEFIEGVKNAYYRLLPKDSDKVYWLKSGEYLSDIIEKIIN